MPKTKTTISFEEKKAYNDGWLAGRMTEREHCNNVLRQFFKTFDFGTSKTIEEAEAHNDQ